MIAVVTIVLAFPLGYFVRSRLAANTTYAIAYLWAFVYQSLYLTLDSFSGGANPAFEGSEFPLAYGVVTLAIFGVGFGLIAAGGWVRAKRKPAEQAARTDEGTVLA